MSAKVVNDSSSTYDSNALAESKFLERTNFATMSGEADSLEAACLM